MRRIAKLVDVNARRSYNLTNLIRAGIKQITLGRAEANSDQLIRLGELEDGKPCENLRVPCISRRHATIVLENGNYILEDYSTLGTEVNGKKLSGKYILEDKDQLRFADYGPVIFMYEDVSRLERVTAQSLPKSR